MRAKRVRVEENVTTKTKEELEDLVKRLLERGYSLYTLTEEFADMFNCTARVTYDREYIVLNLQPA